MNKTFRVTVVAAALVPFAPAARGEHFACNMKGLSATERTRHGELTHALLKAVAEKAELPDGYGVRLDRALLPVAAEWIALETKCCPFFTFQLELGRKEGPLWLRLTGADGVKPFIRDELGF